MIKIDKNIPIPPPDLNKKIKYPWRTMEIGDSFFVEKDYVKFSGNLGFAKASTGRNFTARREGKGTRVWRTA